MITGCAAPGQPTGPTDRLLRIADRDAFIDDTLTLLRENDIEPRRVDRELGEIIAGPTTAAQWFEFWRIDAPGEFNALESNLHTIRHVVTVRVPPTPEAGEDGYRVSVQADKSRLSAPERQITTAGAALAAFSERVPTESGFRETHREASAWIPLGRNSALEQVLLERIARCAAHAE